MKRSTMLIGVSAAAATLAATFQFAGGLGGDAPVAGGSVVVSTGASTSSTTSSSIVLITEPPVTALPAPTSAETTVPETFVPEMTVPDTTRAPNADTSPPTTPADDAVREVLAELKGLVVADPEPNRERYDRDTYQPGGWADLDGDCISGRHEVLITQSAIPVQMTSSRCSVESGLWTDPYTGTVVTEASEITIDHVVPLSEAHRAGAWRWDSATKIAFANDETPGMLVAVIGSVNQAKGDKTPDEWLPLRADFHCAYATNWVTTKARWQLSVTQSEATTLVRILSSCAAADIPPMPAATPPLIVFAPPPVPTTIGIVELIGDGTGAGDVQIAQCQRREERVVLVNPTAAAISLAGFQLHDEESRHSTMLDPFGSIGPGGTLVILTGEDNVASDGEVVWKRQNVWNNDGDTAYLVTPAGSVTSSRC